VAFIGFKEWESVSHNNSFFPVIVMSKLALKIKNREEVKENGES